MCLAIDVCTATACLLACQEQCKRGVAVCYVELRTPAANRVSNRYRERERGRRRETCRQTDRHAERRHTRPSVREPWTASSAGAHYARQAVQLTYSALCCWPPSNQQCIRSSCQQRSSAALIADRPATSVHASEHGHARNTTSQRPAIYAQMRTLAKSLSVKCNPAIHCMSTDLRSHNNPSP